MRVGLIDAAPDPTGEQPGGPFAHRFRAEPGLRHFGVQFSQPLLVAEVQLCCHGSPPRFLGGATAVQPSPPASGTRPCATLGVTAKSFMLIARPAYGWVMPNNSTSPARLSWSYTCSLAC